MNRKSKKVFYIKPFFLKRFLFCCFFISFPLMALEEADLTLLYKLLKDKDFYSIGEFQGENKLTLRYAKFGKKRGKKGSLIFINGKGENILKYMELFHDFHTQGWSPIYTYDHRGQGFSQRSSFDSTYLPKPSVSPQKIESSEPSLSSITASYVKDYALYRKDMETFMHLVLSDKDVDRFNLFLIAHSMGGTVLLDYLQTHGNKQPLKAVALSAPMIKIESNMFFFLENATLKLLTGYCHLLPCSWRFPSLRSRFTQKTLTNSKSRYAFSEYLVKQMFPQVTSKGTSFRWVVESFEVSALLMTKNRIQRMSTPFIILQSEQERFVVNEYQNFFCEKTPYCCQIKKIQGKHEIFMEKDEPRNKAIKTVIEFFDNQASLKKSISSRCSLK